MSDNQPPPSVAEITALTARLRALSDAGRDGDPAEQARFLADKQDLIERITVDGRADPGPFQRGRAAMRWALAADAALSEIVRVRAEHGQYVLVGPSAQTWRTDPATGQPAAPASGAEHRAVRELLGRDELTTTEPAYRDGSDGGDVVSAVIPAAVIPVADKPDTGDRDSWADNHGYTAGEDCADSLTAERGLSGGEGPLLDAGPALTAEEAAHELAADGIALDHARALVRGYLDEVSAQIGTPVHQWGLDQADLTDIRAHAGDLAPEHAAVWHNHQMALDRAVTADGADRYTRADVHEADPWAADPWADYRTHTSAEAADQLIARGIPPDRAPLMVQRYRDELTAARGEPAIPWGVDDDDLTTMLDPTPPGAPPAAGERAPSRGGPGDEDERRARLATWHSTDINSDVTIDATAHADTANDNALVQQADDGADAGWAR